jgi:hypothetical protein
MQKKCRFENKLVKPENWTGQEFTFSPTVTWDFLNCSFIVYKLIRAAHYSRVSIEV